MSEISAELIKDLRLKTGAGLLDCKKALAETGGDVEKAIENLRKSGAAKAEKKAGRIAAEGRVEILIEGNQAVLVEVNSETDFVAKNEDFQKFVREVAAHLLKNKVDSVEKLLETPFQGNTLKGYLQGLVAKIGENISIRRFTFLQAGADEQMGSYTHMGNKIGVIVKGKGLSAHPEILKDIAMHVAASAPQYLAPSDIPSEVIAKEKEIYLEQLKDSGKPAHVNEKIVEGKVNRFFDEVCLLNQPFVKDPSGKLSVSQVLGQIRPDAKIVEFVRYQVGEGIAKKTEDFASEVAKQLQ